MTNDDDAQEPKVVAPNEAVPTPAAQPTPPQDNVSPPPPAVPAGATVDTGQGQKPVGEVKAGDPVVVTDLGPNSTHNIQPDAPVVVEDDDIVTNIKAPQEENASSSDDTITADADVDEDDVVMLDTETDEETPEGVPGEVAYPEDQIDLRGESIDRLAEAMRTRADEVGGVQLDALVRNTGSWENIVARGLFEPNWEQMRISELLGSLTPEEVTALGHRYPKDKSQKAILRTASIIERPEGNEPINLSGDAAMMAFEYQEKGGGYRIPLYNSGITIDLIAPTGSDMQTMLSNCIQHDKELGAASGTHYFTYGDLIYKTQIINFLQPLITRSSYVDWRKKDKLWSVIKLADLPGLVATLAAMCYKDGFDGFVTRCVRPVDEQHPVSCTHTEKLTANIFEMIVTRFSVMNEDAIKHMSQARESNAKHTLQEIAKYQASLGLEGERLTFGNTTFVMRLPTVREHLTAGAAFIADIINEIDADNNEGRYEQFGYRYVRTFLPWIAMVEKQGPSGPPIRTTEPKVIQRELEKVDDRDKDSELRDAMRKFINKSQLTYVGYPVLACPTCGYHPDTPAGMWTFDPFSAFFTLAFLSLNKD